MLQVLGALNMARSVSNATFTPPFDSAETAEKSVSELSSSVVSAR